MLLVQQTIDKFGFNPIERYKTHLMVCVECDYCHKEYDVRVMNRKVSHEIVAKDCCKPCRKLKEKEICLIKYGVDNANKRPETRAKMSQLNGERFKSQEFKDQAKKTSIEKYGVDIATKSPEIKAKVKKTLKKKYGVEAAVNIPGVKERIKETCLEKYGATTYLTSEEGKEEIAKINTELYGFAHPIKNEKIKERVRQSNRVKYGYDYPLQDPVRSKHMILTANQTKVKMGMMFVHEGKGIKELAEECGFSTCRFRNLIKEHGIDAAMLMSPRVSSLEQFMAKVLTGFGVTFETQFPVENRFADFYIPVHNLIIETDGLYWHSDSYREKNYHLAKKKLYEDHGHNSLFFYDSEVYNQTAIVKSMIQNKLGQSQRVFARKCTVGQNLKSAPQFISNNHLMGKGKGDYFSLLDNSSNMVACMQIKRVRNNEHEISRFCNLANINVIGGFSKLLQFALKTLKIKTLHTFIDKRYGVGNYLNQLGFVQNGKCLPSFKWTDGSSTYHRMKFPSSTGYQHGMVKIWDCGQQKYTLNIP